MTLAVALRLTYPRHQRLGNDGEQGTDGPKLPPTLLRQCRPNRFNHLRRSLAYLTQTSGSRVRSHSAPPARRVSYGQASAGAIR
jgi:hypothetical protein